MCPRKALGILFIILRLLMQGRPCSASLTMPSGQLGLGKQMSTQQAAKHSFELQLSGSLAQEMTPRRRVIPSNMPLRAENLA